MRARPDAAALLISRPRYRDHRKVQILEVETTDTNTPRLFS